MSQPVQRKLTTILAADAEGYSRLSETDEVGTVRALRASRDVFTRFIDRHNGRIANTAGDGLIAEFPSVVEAVQCAIEVQRELGSAADDMLRFRIGVHLGDVIVDGDDLLGEGVNLAARLQSMAEPGAVLISRQVYDQVHSKLSVGFEYLGEKRPKNYAENVAVYGISLGEPKVARAWGRRKPEPEVRSSHRESEPPVHTEPAGLRDRVMRHAKQSGTAWLVLAAIDLFTGGPFWAHWPGLAMLMLLGLEAAPLFAQGRWTTSHVRGAVTIAGLFLINFFTWSGTLWAVWPAGAILAVTLIRGFGNPTVREKDQS